MARRRSVVPVLASLAIAASGWSQEPAPSIPAPCPPPPPPGAPGEPDGRHRGPGPEGSQKPDGERRDGRGHRGDGRGRSEWFGDKRPFKENLTPEQMKERAMRELEKLTPEQRHEVWRAVWAVLNLTPEKKQDLIGKEDDRRKKVKEEIEGMLKRTGLQIPDDQKRKFFHRYFSGRRAIEEQIKKDEEERRQTLMGELETKLKQEFGTIAPQPTAPATPDAPK